MLKNHKQFENAFYKKLYEGIYTFKEKDIWKIKVKHYLYILFDLFYIIYILSTLLKK